MTGLIIRRVVLAFPTMFVVSVIMFLLLMVGPNPLDQLKQNPNFRPEDIQRLTKQFGWDKPLPVQYKKWATGFVKGDFGTSIQTQRPAREMIAERLPLTLMLTGLSMIMSLIIAVPIGAYVAVHKYSKADYIATFSTFLMMATPSFFLGLLLQLGALKMQDALGGTLVFYTGGAPACIPDVLACIKTPIEVFQRLALPVTALSLLQVAGWSRYLRSELLTVLGSDYIKCAIAKGLPGRRVFIWHAMRNSLLPIVTIMTIDLALLFGGATITERVFALPGMGNLLLDSVMQKDVVVALAIVMIATLLVLIANTVSDIMYPILDPRVRAS